MTTINPISVKGKGALVTGASGGFGRHFAEVLESAAADIRNSGGTAVLAST